MSDPFERIRLTRVRARRKFNVQWSVVLATIDYCRGILYTLAWERFPLRHMSKKDCADPDHTVW